MEQNKNKLRTVYPKNHENFNGYTGRESKETVYFHKTTIFGRCYIHYVIYF